MVFVWFLVLKVMFINSYKKIRLDLKRGEKICIDDFYK